MAKDTNKAAPKLAVKLLAKISYKTVCGKVNRRELPEDKSPLHVMRIMGQATKTVTGNTDFGAFVGFMGNFEATNVRTGEIFRSGKCFLPPVATNLLEGAVAGANGAPVMFAFDIGVKEDDESSVGYVYTATPILDAGEADPIEQMKKTINAPALPAPVVKADAKKTGEKAST